MMNLISIVVPTHNEALNVEPLYLRIAEVFEGMLDCDFELIFADDSTDDTPERVAALNTYDARVKLVRLSRRFGQAIAITAGIDRARGDAVVLMDADLQDPPESIPALIDRWREGNEIVYVQRASGSTYALYRVFAFIFYRLLRKFASVEIPVDAGEFRLLDRKVVGYLQKLTEHTRYLRGLTLLPGFRQAGIQISRAERVQGATNYNFTRSLLVAIDGIFSFSILPLRIATFLGFAMTLVSMALGGAYMVWRLLDPAIFGPGWPSIFISMFFLGGLQLIVLGILGEYVARIFTEVQNRPVYWVDYQLGFTETVDLGVSHLTAKAVGL
ncbi:MAG: glycosyltransferase family 2 protein [Acidobacteriaceae bacterium]|nr:glycosyltransferase family 2 protein [Acidobacteriaceae bacterium]